MPAKYFCDKCGKEVDEHEHYVVSFLCDPLWMGSKKYYIGEDIYLCEEDTEAVVFVIKKFLNDLLEVK